MHMYKLVTVTIGDYPCICFPLRVKLSTGFLIRVGIEAEDKDREQDIPHQQSRSSQI